MIGAKWELQLRLGCGACAVLTDLGDDVCLAIRPDRLRLLESHALRHISSSAPALLISRRGCFAFSLQAYRTARWRRTRSFNTVWDDPRRHQ